VAAVVVGADVVQLLYKGAAYPGLAHIVTVMALGALASALGLAANNGLSAIDRPDVNFKASLFALAVALAVVGALVGPCQVLGAAYGFLAGNVAGAAARCWAFFRLTAAAPGQGGEA
jgi:O-antigen/teichoic acid export membrane protein